MKNKEYATLVDDKSSMRIIDWERIGRNEGLEEQEEAFSIKG